MMTTSEIALLAEVKGFLLQLKAREIFTYKGRTENQIDNLISRIAAKLV